MKPDFDDFDDYTSENDTPRSRAMSWLVLGVALSGFIALAWYAYHSGSESIQDGQMVVIAADDSPLKTKPIAPGGEEFPHQDKTIYETISPYRTEQNAKVEKLLPEAEEPVADTAPKATETKTWVNDKLRQVSDAEEKINEQLDSVPAAKEEAKKEDVKPEPTVAPKEEEPKEAPKPVEKPVVKEEPKPAPVIIKKEEAKVATAAPVDEVKTEAPKTVEAVKETPKPTPAPAVASGSGFKIQLGAFKSQAEAEQNWARISSKHADVLGGFAHLIVKADLPNGTYYRLRVSGYATAEAAKLACAKLSARSQGCFFAGK